MMPIVESDAPIERSRVKIENLLRKWGCQQIGWLEDTERGVYEIQFRMKSEEGVTLSARFHIFLEDGEYLTERQEKRRNQGRFRTLYLWLEGALRAVEAGIIEPEAIFLAWLAGPDGVTVWEAIRPDLKRLAEGGATKLLGSGK